MVKILQSAGGALATTLVILGWLSFILLNFIEIPIFVFVLQVAARVLPKSLTAPEARRPDLVEQRQALRPRWTPRTVWG